MTWHEGLGFFYSFDGLSCLQLRNFMKICSTVGKWGILYPRYTGTVHLSKWCHKNGYWDSMSGQIYWSLTLDEIHEMQNLNSLLLRIHTWIQFLAHLSRRLEWAIAVRFRPSSVVRRVSCVVRKLFTFSSSWKRMLDFNQTCQESSLGLGDSKLFK